MTPRKTQTGISLIEVLIAVVVVAIGLLGIAGMQSVAIQNNYLANQFTTAAMQTQALAERMRANREGLLAGAYTLGCGVAPAEPAVDCGDENCNPAEMAAWDLSSWIASITDADGGENVTRMSIDALPQARVQIQCVAPCDERALRNINLCWDSTRGGAENNCQPNADNGISCYALSVRP